MSEPAQSSTTTDTEPDGIQYIQYHSDKEIAYLSAIRQLISKDLSEPYSIYVYRYFLYQWGDLCFLVCLLTLKPAWIQNFNGLICSAKQKALDPQETLLGVVISKLEKHRGSNLRGYIAMLAVREEHRGKGVATKLVRMAIDAMIEKDADEVNPDANRFSDHFHADNAVDCIRNGSD